MQLLYGALAALVVAILSWRLHVLSLSGAIAAAVLGTLVFGLGGPVWAAPLLTFFVLSSLLSRLAVSGRKEEIQRRFEKGSERDAWQVLANGGIAGMMVIFFAFEPSVVYFVAYLGALAAAAADTWGTEIGTAFGGRVVSAAGFRAVEPGSSGGLSLAGTLAAATGAATIGLSVVPWVSTPVRAIVIALIAGLVGMFADGLGGALLQGKYTCSVCGIHTERSRHCDKPTTMISGSPIVGNDTVNIIATATGALVGAVAQMGM